MRNVTFGKIISIVALFCCATTIAASAQTYTTLLSFNGADGDQPVAPLAQGLDGNLYGTAAFGGTNYSLAGDVFKIGTNVRFKVIYNFCALPHCADGDAPQAGLILDSSGAFYGTTSTTVFKMTPDGTLTTLYTFCSLAGCTDGQLPQWALTKGIDGNFYGTTVLGGANDPFVCETEFDFGCGTIFRISPTGQLTTIYSFCAQSECTDGFRPEGTLLLASDGNFYGTTRGGGKYHGGTVFKVTRTGKFTTVYDFCSKVENQTCVDGSSPYSGLIQGADGFFYGTTAWGGTGSYGSGAGTVFRLTALGKLTTLYNFCPQYPCSDGEVPYTGLAQGTDGNLYGVTTYGGSTGNGTIFDISPQGQFTTLYSFCSKEGCADGGLPYATLVQATTGVFYGVTEFGGLYTDCPSGICGTIYSLDMGLGPFIESNPTFGKVGYKINILGNDLTGTTTVTFNGTPATFTVVSNSYLRATVPTGATTGTIRVMTASGTLSSNVAFHVIP